MSTGTGLALRPPRLPAAVLVRPRAAVALTVVSALGVVAFCWPLVVEPGSALEGNATAPWLFVALLPLLLAVVLAEVADGGMDAKAVAVLRGLAAAGHAVLLATHDVELAATLTDRTVVLAEGEVVSDGPSREVVVASPAFAPQVAKVLAPQPWLTVAEVAHALRAG